MKSLVTIVALFGLFFLGGCKLNEADTFPPDKVFIKFYGGQGTEKAADFLVRDDGGYVLFGTTTSGAVKGVAEPSGNFYVVFADRYGNQEGASLVIDREVYADPTDKSTKISTTETASRIRQTSDGGYVLIGSSSYEVPGSAFSQSDIFVVRLNAARQVTNILPIGSVFDDDSNERPSDEIGVDIVEYRPNRFILAGTTTDRRLTTAGNGADIFVAKLLENFSGVEIHNITPGTDDETVAGIETDRGFVDVFGSTNNNFGVGGANSQVIYLQRDTTDLGGREREPAGDGADDFAVRVKKNGVGDYYVIGNSVQAGVSRPFVIRYIAGAHQEPVYVTTEPGSPRILANDLIRLPGSDFVLAGERLPANDLQGSEMLLMRFDAGGELDPSFMSDDPATGQPNGMGRLFGGNGNDRAVAVHRLTDGSLVFLGDADLDGNGNTYMCLVKANSRGVLEK